MSVALYVGGLEDSARTGTLDEVVEDVVTAAGHADEVCVDLNFQDWFTTTDQMWKPGRSSTFGPPTPVRERPLAE